MRKKIISYNNFAFNVSRLEKHHIFIAMKYQVNKNEADNVHLTL